MNSYLKCIEAPVRFAVLYSNESELRTKLQEAKRLSADGPKANRVCGNDGFWWNNSPSGVPPAVAFLYPGQGSQYVGMLDGLRMAVPDVGRRLNELHADWIAADRESLFERIYCARTPESESALRETQRAQPAIGMLSVAVAAGLRNAGVTAAFHAGHSYGELPSLHGAGWINDRTLLALSAERGRLLALAGSSAPGTMIALFTNRETAIAICREAGHGAEIVNFNAPMQSVAAGTLESIEAVEREAARRGVAAKRIPTSAPFHHSQLIRPVAGEWNAALHRLLKPVSGHSVAFSNVTGKPYQTEAEIVDLLTAQIISSVEWTIICRELRLSSVTVFIETGPGHVLSQLVRENFPQAEPPLVLAADPGRDASPAESRRHWLVLLAKLWCSGVNVRWREYEAQELQVIDNATALSSSRALVERYFDQQRTLAELAANRAASAEERVQIVQAALLSNERIMTEFLAASQILALGKMPPEALVLPSPVIPPEPEKQTLKEALRTEIAKATGFPVDSINDKASFVDLGLDSLSIAEIWGQLLDAFPEITAFAEHMFSVRCIQDLDRFTSVPLSATLVEEIESVAGETVFEREIAIDAALAHHPRHRQAGRELLNAPDRKALASLLEKFDAPQRLRAAEEERVERFVVGWERINLPVECQIPKKIRFVSPVHGTASVWLRELLGKHADISGGSRAPVIFLAEADTSVDATIERSAGAVFTLAKSLPAGTPLLVVSYGEADTLTAGLAGLVLSLRREVAGSNARYICLTTPPSAMNENLLLRVLFADTAEPVLREAGGWAEKRTAEWTATPSIVRQQPPRLGSDSRILVLGGGDGISAEMGVALAARYRCEIVAVGRTPFPETQPYREVPDGPGAPAEIRKRILADGIPVDRAAALSRQTARQRALWRTRQRVLDAGGEFTYFPCDLGMEADVHAAIARILERGPIHGLLHGAGIALDNRIERKSLDEFLSVVRPKAISAALLPQLLEGQPLQFAIFLSSMTAFTGTAGQTDYATGNEILNAVARTWNSRVEFPVKSLMWSVWTETGFASPNLKKHMDRLELGGIKTADGIGLFLRELTEGGKWEDNLLLAPRSTLRYSSNATPASVLLAAGAGAGQ